ncbi:MAG: aldo/keto reductase [Micavibrio sp.]
MDYMQTQGVSIPKLGFGTWRLTGAGCTKSVELALDVGYHHIDTAQIYENETEVGQALANTPIDRADIFLTTKVWMSNVSKKNMARSVEESLKKLKTDYVDLLLIHWPVFDVPLQEQAETLAALQETGKARLIGVSNYPVAMMRTIREDYGIKIANNQIEYHPFLSQKPVIDYARTHDMTVTAYSPLARGGISGHPVLKAIGDKHGKSEGQIALRWLIQQENIAAIPKAASENNIRNNINIFDFTLSDHEMNAIFTLARPDGRLINPDWAPEWDVAA